jgi:hypothetical protein
VQGEWGVLQNRERVRLGEKTSDDKGRVDSGSAVARRLGTKKRTGNKGDEHKNRRENPYYKVRVGGMRR